MNKYESNLIFILLQIPVTFIRHRIQQLKLICVSKAVFTLYGIVKRTVAESVLDRASVHTRKAAFEAFSAPPAGNSAAPLHC